jgi:hypothetical protein
MLDLLAPPATITRLLLVIIFSTCLAAHTAAFASSKTVVSSPVITAVGRQQQHRYIDIQLRHQVVIFYDHDATKPPLVAMSSATTAITISIADSTFWIGFYGLLQVTHGSR